MRDPSLLALDPLVKPVELVLAFIMIKCFLRGQKTVGAC